MALFDKLKKTLIENLGGQVNTQNNDTKKPPVTQIQQLSNAEIVEREVNKFRNKLNVDGFYFPQNGQFAFGKTKEAEIRDLYELNKTDKIYLVFYKFIHKEGGIFSADRSFDYSMIFTEEGLTSFSFQIGKGWTDEDDADEVNIAEWRHIESAEPTESSVNIIFKNSNETKEIKFTHINDDTYFGLDFETNKNLAKLIESIASQYSDNKKNELDKISEEVENKNWEQVLNLCDNFEKKYGENSEFSFLVADYKANAHITLQNFKKAIQVIDDELKFFENEENIKRFKSWYSGFHVTKGIALSAMNDYQSALNCMQIGVEYADTNKEKSEIQETIIEIYSEYKEQFVKQEFKNKSVIFVDKQFTPVPVKSFNILLKDHLPELVFPVGHPVERNLYVCHPYKHNFYYPINSFEAILFRDRVDEFTYLLSCLGAVKIEIEYKQGKNIEKLNSETQGFSGGLTVKGIGGGANYENTDSGSSKEQIQTSTKIVKTFPKPNQKPFLPENLVWYHKELSWQSLYNERINRGLLDHRETISSKQIKDIFQSKFEQLNTEINVIAVTSNFSHLTSIQSTLKTQEYTIWDISVQFAPLNENQVTVAKTSQNDSKSEVSENEQKYLDEIKFALEDDGKIDEDERKMIERKRQKFGISEQRAKELEDSILNQNQFTSEENEYLEEIKTIFETDNEISENDRRILERKRIKLNISVERAKELELFLTGNSNPQYTENELKYIEELKFCLEDDGEISASERRMLNKERDKLGINEQRADEIEKEFIKTIKR